MATQTKRDKIWGTSLRLAFTSEEFDITEVLVESGFDESTKRTARDVLTSMATQGWIEKRTCERTGRRVYSGSDQLLENYSIE